MANILDHDKRVKVVTALVNGNGPRATSRMTDVHQDTVSRLGFAVGVGCRRLHDRMARDLACSLVDFDEQHSYVGKRQRNFDPAKDDPALVGEQWTWASICRTSKFSIDWHVGKRDGESADVIVRDTRARLAVMPQVTTDGLDLYVAPIAKHFGYGVDYAQQVKRVGAGGGNFIEKRVIFGAPDLGKVTTYAAERSFGTNRCWNPRFVRKTLRFSKHLDMHVASVDLQYVYRNLVWIPRNMSETAAMAIGVTDHLWSIEELMVMALAEPEGEKPRAKPLTFRVPSTTARELPEGRGFLRVVPSGGGGSTPAAPFPPGPAPASPAPPALMPAEAMPAVAEPRGQLDLLAWRPRPAAAARPLPPPGTQLDLFR